MQIWGLIGGIGSGKSTVASMFQDFSQDFGQDFEAAVINADRIGHQILQTPAIITTLVGRWGDSILDENSQISRTALANIVFPNPMATNQMEKHTEREFLNSLLHPRIQREIEVVLREFERQKKALIMLDAPLLLEVGWEKLASQIVFIDAPQWIRLKRILSRGWSEAEFLSREAAQWPLEEKRRRADFVIDNSQDVTKTRSQVQKILREFFPEQERPAVTERSSQ